MVMVMMVYVSVYEVIMVNVFVYGMKVGVAG